MYSYADRIKAVALYIKSGLNAANTVRELGYPSRRMLFRWYKEYKETGRLHERSMKQSKYTSAQKEAAVNYYLRNGRSISRTIRAVGYPSKTILRGWMLLFTPPLIVD